MNYLEYNQVFKSWPEAINSEFEKEYMLDIDKFLVGEGKKKKNIYPPKDEIFRAFSLTNFNDIKVVIIGQDPYHGVNQAHGLCFSVARGMKIPPSLRNIFKELKSDCKLELKENQGDLSKWAQSGVLLLNNVLTVEEKKPASHKNCGWEDFTDFVVDLINTRLENVVFLLWGAHAQTKGKSIDRKKHCVLESTHPSPFSAYRGFLGCQHFSRANQYLKEHNLDTVDWSL